MAGSAPRLPLSTLDDVPVACGVAILLILYWDRLATGASARTLSFVVFALAVIVAVAAARSLRDGLNSITVLLALCLVRIAAPAVILVFSDIPQDTFLTPFGVTRADLVDGQQLAAIGMLSVIVGWYACPAVLARGATRLHRFAGRTLTADRRIAPSAAFAFGAGVVAALIYLTISFGNPFAAALSGVARGSSVPGASRYGFAAVGLLITSALVLTLHLATRPTVPRVLIFAPALVAGSILTIFGGRIGALTPLGLSGIGIFYLRRARLAETPQRGTRLTRILAIVVLVGGLVFAYFSFVAAYRGGSGAGAVRTALSGEALRDYAKSSMWTEIGTLHSYALAERLGGGTMAGSTYPEVLGFVGQALGLHGERPGQVIVKDFGPPFDSSWGFHTGLVVDVYVNSGLVWCLLAGILFGALLRAEYVGFRRASAGFGSTFLHCLCLWTLIWVYFESVIVLPTQFQLALPTVALIILGAHVLPSGRASVRRAPIRRSLPTP
jgi:hypothetical protein